MKISILKMRAWADFDMPYEIDIAAGDFDRVYKFSRVLNTFCRQLPGCAQDVKLSKYLEDKEYAEQLMHQFIGFELLSTKQAITFVEKLKSLCKGHNVYVYENAFIVNDVVQI